ncbi:ribosome biogenesis GTP-binding protein YihA/YsxC [Anaeromusa sp.]|uniref:ribosome biogenesis GTP-binding protein YihA/YsxC n=1 Tax=Anaeromusa sp. TaxID=1872520 RepID=UPI002629BD2D|nr:ribosome biogenesis GTP-binding protein YihA/YsxC [Anaeromusa sp.]MDD3157868.1 ribosome biogenesis GTP-binding protein YihA/YsxC [Anaeromusa sp.]
MSSEKERLDIIQAQYVASAVRRDQFPEEALPEVAFIGRSNVGKSSLINSVCRHRGLARTSGTPGKTQTINFFKVLMREGEERLPFHLVDLPGYGYAKTGQEKRKIWSRFIADYFTQSPYLRLVCLLVDIRHAPMPSDIEMFRRLADKGLPLQLILTKADKISKNQVASAVANARKSLQTQGIAEVMAYSAQNGQGRQELLDLIKLIL